MLGRHGAVVGVLADFRYGHPPSDARPLGFALAGYYWSDGIAVVRSSQSTAALRGELAGLVAAGTLELSVDDVTPLTALRRELIAADRARGLLTIGAAVVVVLVALFGFYGTQRYLVAAGRREYAIRAALGAGPRALGGLVLRRGLVLSLPGLALGAMLAFVLVAWLRGDFVASEISPLLVTLSVITGTGGLLLAACRGPAREARHTQPASLLRED